MRRSLTPGGSTRTGLSGRRAPCSRRRPTQEAINKVSIGICLEGNFEHREPEEIQLEAARKLIDDIEARYVKRQLIVTGHKEHRPTICPGTDWHIWGAALIEGPPPDPFCEAQAREALGRLREAKGLLDAAESDLEEVIGNETDG